MWVFIVSWAGAGNRNGIRSTTVLTLLLGKPDEISL